MDSALSAVRTRRFVRALSPPTLAVSPPFFSPISAVAMSHPPPEGTPEQPHDYPKPLSPPLPAVSKQIELSRALSASSRSDRYELSKGDVVYADDWLLVVNKPQGVYCESVLKSAHHLVSVSGAEGEGGKLVSRFCTRLSIVLLIPR